MQRKPSLWLGYLTLSLVAFGALVALTLAAPSPSTTSSTATAALVESSDPVPISSGEPLAFSADTLVVTHLLGTVEVLPTAGSQFEVEVRFVGEGAEESLKVHTREGSTAEVAIQFPVDRVRKYRYTDAGRMTTQLTLPLRRDGESSGGLVASLFRQLSGDRIEISDRRGTEMWADLTVRVPAGKTLDLVLGAGKIQAVGVEGDLSLDSHGGPITMTGLQGTIRADTGSGSISGEDLDGRINLDTGSGSISLRHARGPEVLIDTGSGSVKLANVDSERLLVDTGSGTVRGEALGADDLDIDTGSGGVEVELVRMGTGKFVVDTGSGTVNFRLPRGASARIVADTGSGGIRFDLEDAEVLHQERSNVLLSLGTGAAEVLLDTGSGSVTVGHS
jgi:hypothetical protein